VLDQRVRHVAERLLDRLLIVEQGLLRLGGCRVHAGADPAPVEDRQGELRRDREQSLRAEPAPIDLDAAGSRRHR
jgi:hypothetical protein